MSSFVGSADARDMRRQACDRRWLDELRSDRGRCSGINCGFVGFVLLDHGSS